MRRAITTEEISRIRDLVASGFPSHEISKMIGRTLKTVKYIRSVHEIRPVKKEPVVKRIDDERKQLDLKHVQNCLAQGGFPVVELIDERPVWLWPNEPARAIHHLDRIRQERKAA